MNNLQKKPIDHQYYSIQIQTMKNQFYLIRIVISLFFLLLLSNTHAQIPAIEWDKTAGGNDDDLCMDIIQTADGGYVASGRSRSGISGDKTETSRGGIDYWLIKIDPSGTTIQWQKRLGTSGNDMPAGIVQTPDGGIMVSGQSSGGINGDRTVASYGSIDYWLLKLDITGTPVWQTAFGGSNNDMGYNMTSATNGGFIIGGASMSGTSGTRAEPNRGDYDYWIIKMDSSRNIQWNKAIGGSGWEQLNAVIETHDKGFILAGASRSGISFDKTDTHRGGLYDYWIVKIDSNRNIQWQKTIGGAGDDYLHSVQQTSDSGYILAGHSNSGISGDKTDASHGGSDYWIIKLDAAGNITWQKTIGGSGDETIFSSNAARQTSDGGYLVSGTSNSGISGNKTEPSKGGTDYWLVKLDNTGSIQWQKTIGGSGNDDARAFQLTADGGCIIGGFSSSPISGDKTEANRGGDDFWIVKLLPPCDTTKTYVTDSFCLHAGYTLPGGSIVATPGIYYDTLTTSDGCDSIIALTLTYIDDSISARVKNILGPDTVLCKGDSYLLTAPYPGATTYQWSSGPTASSVTVHQSGEYHVAITSQNGCKGYDTINITFMPPPVIDLGNDTGICDKDIPFVLTHPAPGPGATHYLWSNGLSDTMMNVTYTGLFWLQLTTNNCTASDSIYIEVVKTPGIFIGNDSIICEQFPLRIGYEINGADYRWNTEANSPYINVNTTGDYTLTVNLNGCIVHDTIHIEAMPRPLIDLGDDGDICPEETVILDGTSQPGSRYRWNTGDTTAVHAANTAGTYSVTVTSRHGCTGDDTITLSFYPKPVIKLGMDTVVCEETPLCRVPRSS